MAAVLALRADDAAPGVSQSDAGQYFEHVRTDVRALLPASATRVLEIGCGTGKTLAFVREHYKGSAYTVGVDGWAGGRESLAKNADEAIIADLNGAVPLNGSFDLILALDVLEHLERPEEVLGAIVRDHLAPGGTVIVSLPNFGHIKVWGPLAFQNDYQPEDQGIKDRTHRHITTRRGSVRMLNTAGLVVERGLVSGRGGPKRGLLNNLTFGTLKHWLGDQHIMLAHRGDGQGAVSWAFAH
jgi:SAM-dependent methyltransferase